MRKYRRRGFLKALPFLLPSMIGFILFIFVPIIIAVLISQTSWNGLAKISLFDGFGKMIAKEYVGIQNFIQILKGQEFWDVLGNTLYFIVLYIPLVLVASLGVASILNSRFRGITAYRIMYYIPVLTSWVAGALIWKWVLSPEYGAINDILGLIGIEGPGWLQDEKWAMPGIVLASVWKDVGFYGLILLGGLKNINPTYYEAAEIDGANGWQKFRHITLPLLSPVTFFVIIICLIFSFQLFPQVMIMTESGPFGSTQVIVERIYRYGFEYFKMGYAAAYSWLLFAIIFVLTIVQFKLQRKWVHYDS